MRVSRFYIYFIITLVFSPIYAQDYLLPEVLTVENGLSSRNVSSIAIDHKGYLWAGTKGGLNRYNGYGFKQFFTPSGDNGSAGMQNILGVQCDAQGNIWILSDAGVNRIDHKTGYLAQYPISKFDTVYDRDARLKDIYPASDGTTWILSDRSLTAISADEVINTYLIPVELLPNASLPVALAADPKGNVWIGTNGGLLLFSMQQKKFREVVGERSQDLLTNNEVYSLYLDEENSLWVGTANGLNRVDPVDFAFYHYFPGNTSSIQPGNRISDITSLGKEAILLATDAGIFKFGISSQQFSKVYTTDNFKIHSVALDSTGIIWGGTSQGLLKIRESKLSVRNFNTQSKPLKLPRDHVTALLKGGNKLFVGYNKNEFSVIDIKTLTSENFNTTDGSPVVDFHPFRENEYLVISEHAIEVFTTGNRRSSLFKIYPFLKKELVEDVKIKCAYYDGEDCLWLGTSKGLQSIRYDSAKHNDIRSLSYQNQQIDIGPVHDINSDPFGNMWLGTDIGLIFYNPSRGNFIRYTPYDVSIMNTEHKSVYTIITEKPGVFYIGTSGGVFRFEISSRKFTAIMDKPEIMNATVKALRSDIYGNLWLGTANGLFHYIKNNNTIITYDLKEGLLNDSYTAIATDLSGEVFLAGPQGLSVIKAPEISSNGRTPRVVISAIRYIENGIYNADLFYQVPDTIVLPWHRKPLQIEFSILDFNRPEFNRYRYSFGKTKHNKPWQQLESQHYVILDRLPPGKYRFKVTGSGSDMNWNPTGTSLVIIVEAPYWRTKIGLALMIVAGSLLVFLFFRFWIRQFFNLSRENQEREMFAKQIMLQKEELTLKNKSITDSINYAKRIQTAMLPPFKMFKSIFPSSFILFMPKDIVSGDFYWVNKLGNRIFISAVDCTGHGVPGAFMSIIGFELFRKITNIEGLTRPSDILNRLNDDFHEIFKDVDNVVLRDGMDVAFCSIDKKDMILEFAGAFNPLYIIRDNKIMEVKGDRFAIGLDETNFREQTFKNHIIPIQKGDIIYIFSDGFADQFGGPDGKKYKYRRFRHLLLNLHQLPMEKQHEILENNVLEWRGEQDQVDDILVIGIKIDF